MIEITKKQPKVRFKDFAGKNAEDWEQRKYGDLAQVRRGLTYKPSDVQENGVKVLRSSNIDADIFVQREDDVYVQGGAVNIDFLCDGDILITAANGSSRLVGKHAIINGISDRSTVHGGFMLAATTDNPEFLNASMSSRWYSKFINMYVAGGNGAIGNLNKNDLENYKILVPNIHEQEKIGDFFKNLDNLITLHQRELDNKKTLKQTMLSKMFPKDGSDVPEVRFAGFADPWEQRKLAEEVEFFNGLTYSPADVSENGTFVLRSSNVKEGEIVNADNVYVDPQVVNSSNVEEGDIIVVVRNGSRALIGKHTQIKERMDDTVIGAFMTGIRSDQPGFVNALLDTEQFNREIHKNLGATINQITNGMFAKMNFMFPNFEEQQKIGVFFTNLDNLVALHQHELETYQTLKKTMLEKMFV